MIKYINGDLLTSNASAILHQVNCKGVMGGGVAKQIKNKYPRVFEEYKELCTAHTNNPEELLGHVQSVMVNTKQNIVNLFAQVSFGTNKRQTDYDALQTCFRKVNELYESKSVALPFNIGCGLGGGNWAIVLSLIEKELSDCNVFIYKL